MPAMERLVLHVDDKPSNSMQRTARTGRSLAYAVYAPRRRLELGW
jgi:hypothetical protein